EGGRLGRVGHGAGAHRLDRGAAELVAAGAGEQRVQLVSGDVADREGVVGAGDAGGVVCLAAQGGLVAAAVDRVAAVVLDDRAGAGRRRVDGERLTATGGGGVVAVAGVSFPTRRSSDLEGGRLGRVGHGAGAHRLDRGAAELVAAGA